MIWSLVGNMGGQANRQDLRKVGGEHWSDRTAIPSKLPITSIAPGRSENAKEATVLGETFQNVARSGLLTFH